MCFVCRAGMILIAIVALSAPMHGQQRQHSYPTGGPFVDVPVLNAPFSADAITTLRETLPDGSVQEHTLTARYYRDSHGRVRAELDTVWGQYVVLNVRRIPGPGVPDVQYINGDWGPATVYVLDLGKQTYRVGALPFGKQIFNGEGRVALPVGKVVFRYAPAVEGTSDADRLRSVNAQVSPELGLVISSHRSDHIGVVDYKLTNIRREEPPAELFMVPPDYSSLRGVIEGEPLMTLRPWRPRTR